MTKSTLVIGASLKESRHSNICVKTLASKQYPVAAIGLREGFINKINVVTGKPKLDDIHTVTLYLGADNQKPWYDYILNLKPQRVVFNPGAENDEFRDLLHSAGIETIEGCTIVMVQSDTY
jgi:uncharacterized protein